jgi:predicted amidophosphoribosyltransferase
MRRALRTIPAAARAALSSTLRSTWRFALDFGLPPLCPACRGLVGNDGGLCASCWSRLSFIARPYCERLGTPFGYDPGHGVLSTEAVANPPAFARARAAVRYDDIAGALVHALKYGDRLDLAPAMGRWMARAGRELTDGADALVPVPLHWRRLWARRFNQAAALAGAISQASGVPVLDDALKRRRATPQQVGLNRTARSTNVQGAFDVREDRRPPRGPDRRRADVGSDGRRLHARPAARGRRPGGRPGLCPGCRRVARTHINRLLPLHRPELGSNHGFDRGVYDTLLPLLHRGEGASAPQGRRVRRDQRRG